MCTYASVMVFCSPLALITTSPVAVSPSSVAVISHVPALVTVNTAVPPVAVLVCVSSPFSHVTLDPAGQLTVIVDEK